MFRHKNKSRLDWTKKVYYGKKAQKKKRRWKKELKKGKLLPNVYVISFASSETDLFDIIPAWVLSKTDYPRENVKILGIAVGKSEALELVEKLVMKTYLETGGFCVREFFV